MKSFLEYRKEKQSITESTYPSDVPKEAILGRVKNLYDSGRYDVTPETDERGSIKFKATPKKPNNAVDFLHRKGRPEVHWHEPKISTLSTPDPETQYPRIRAELNPDSGYSHNIQDKKTPGVLFRGMSHEEFHNIKKTGKIQSKGEYNMGDKQVGLTYYSKSPEQAQNYAHSFAPLEHRATGQHHAYVVAVKDPGTGVKVDGTGEDEVGIPHAISKDDILHVHVGRAYAGAPGEENAHKSWSGFEAGSGNTPDVSVAWKKMEVNK